MDLPYAKGAGGGGWGATLGAGSRGVMKAAGGLTLRRGDSTAASSGPAKLVSIAVVGLSGGEKEKGSLGSGKSCLCNRFIQPLADDYSVDHISVFSQSDFSGRVVNNDHFLYWGDVRKNNEEGTGFHMQVAEQTEFVDDASFQTFRGSGKSEPYIKRCASTKLVSAEKLMYICKDQLGIEREYEQKVMPDGRFAVDGFVLVYDVSMVPNRSPEKQTEFCAQILSNIMKCRPQKPCVIAATKCDEANEILVRELERLVNRKDFKHLNIPVVETSAHENVNVDAAFYTLAQMIDRTRGRSRILSYYEAAHARREQLDLATETYLRLVRMHVTDYGVLWGTMLKKLGQFQEYQKYVDLFGKDSARRLFQIHVKKLKEDYLNAKINRYFDLIPQVLHDMFPDFDNLNDGEWHSLKRRVRIHPDFERWFVEYPEDTTWMEADLFDGDTNVENRIPFDILEMPDAETIYRNHLNQIHAHQKRLELPNRLRKDFKRLLEEIGCVTPGKSLNELRVLFLGRECFENLPENEVQEIYDLHQRELIQRSKKNFQELLLERADLFYQFRSGPAAAVTQEDILDISDALQEDSRHKALDRLDADRKLLLFQHLGFITCPIREHCPAFPHCTDSLVERIVAAKKAAQGRPPSWSRTTDSNHLNLVVLGVEELASELADQIRAICQDDEFEHQNQIFSLDYRTVSGDVSLPENAFRTQDFLPHGCFCTYSNSSSYEYIRDSLEKTLLSNLEQEDRLPFQGLPLVIVFAAEPNLPDKDLLTLREEGQNLADSLQCPFIDVMDSEERVKENTNSAAQRSSPESSLFKHVMVEDALRALIESIRHRSGLLNIYNKSAPSNPGEPDIRIIMCMLCGDPYSVEYVLGPLLAQQNCYLSSGERSIAIETQLGGDTKRKVEVVLSSYHGATDFRDELVHGFILVYSTKRRASLSNLSALSVDIPELPLQILAVTEPNGQLANIGGGVYMNTGGSPSDSLSTLLISEGSNLADRLNAHFMTSSASLQQKSSFYTPFFKEVFEKKSEIEQAMEDASRLDDSGEGTLERPMRQPLPPPRLDSYRKMRNIGGGPSSNASRSGSGSEIYERLPDSGSQADDLDERVGSDEFIGGRLAGGHESDVYSSLDRTGENGDAGMGTGSTERLVRPSQMKKNKQGWADDSIFVKRSDQEQEGDGWKQNGSSAVNPGAFTTGRGRPTRLPPPIQPRTSKGIPGKLNLNDFQKVFDTLNVSGEHPIPSPSSKKSSPGNHNISKGSNASTRKEEIDQHGYAVPKDNVVNRPWVGRLGGASRNGSAGGNKSKDFIPKSDTGGNEYAIPQLPPNMDQGSKPKSSKHRERRKQMSMQQDSESDIDSSSEDGMDDQNGRGNGIKLGSSSSDRSVERRVRKKPGHPNRDRGAPKQNLAKAVAAPMVPKILPPPPPPSTRSERLPSTESEKAPLENNGGSSIDLGKQQRELTKEVKKRQKEEIKRQEASDKKLQKEQKKQEKEREKKEKKEAKGLKGKANSVQVPTLEDFRTSDDNPIPVFLQKAIEFIEKEGLDAEGLYRVPGNRAHVELLFQKFDENSDISIEELDIAVNAVATAVKDFFFKRLPPLLGDDFMAELETIALTQDKSIKMLELSKLLKRLPRTNFAVIKFIFQHFVRVTERSKENCMDSKNLAICWWPTLLQYEFGDLSKFEAMRPHLEDIVQTMIDQFRFLYCGQEEIMMV